MAMAGSIEAIITQLASADSGERAEAAQRLGQMGPEAAPAAVELVEACRDPHETVREWAVAALEELGPPPEAAVPRLTLLVGDRVPLAGYWASTLLGRCGEAAAEAVSVLADAVGSGADLSVRQRAAWALGQIGPAAAAARGVLEKAAGDPDPRLSRLARDAMAAIG